MDKQSYIDSNVWKGNPFLIQPESAVKRCQCCQENKYSLDFPDYKNEQFFDSKLPVCTQCFRMQDNAGREIVRLTGIYIACKACGVFKPLDEYSYTSGANTLKTACRACGREAFKGISNETK